jgi:hypothetical protein
MDQQGTTISQLGGVEADLVYLAPMAERPHSYTYDPPPGVSRTNTANAPHRVTVHDARPLVADLSLDREAFELVEQRSAVRDFYDEDELRRVYYPTPNAWSHGTPVRRASSSSITRSAAADGARRIAPRGCRVSRRRACTTTTPNVPRHSASAT